jgi:type IV pilus biogenesis protein CpaD/CtpE
MAAAPSFPSVVATAVQNILPADTTTTKTILTAGASGTKITGLQIASSDSSAKIVQVFLTRTAVDYNLITVSIPAGSGNDSTGVLAAIDAFLLMAGLPVDNDGQRYLLLKSGDTLRWSCTTTVTVGRKIDIVAVAADF